MYDKLVQVAGTFEKAAKAKPIYLYHGTAANVLPSIMSQGLIPNPKQRAWQEDEFASIYMPSRQSLQGIYLTGNLMTALGSGNRPGRPDRILIMVSVQSQSLTADEDSLYGLGHPVPSNEFLTAQAYIDAVIGTESVHEILKVKQEYVDVNTQRIISKLKSQPNPKMIERIKQLLGECFIPALARMAAYADDYTWQRALSNMGAETIPRPQKSQAEQAFKQCQDQLTRTLHILSRPSEVSDLFNFTARTNTPIGFNKSNKIIAIFREILKPGSDYQKMLKLEYPNSLDQIPSDAMDKLLSDWKKSMGRGLQITA